MLWLNLITKGFHKSGVGSRITLKKTKYSSGDISGRLVGCKSGEIKINTRPRDNAESPCLTRIFDKCRQIKFNTKPVHNLHRGLIQTRSRDSPANPGESTRDSPANPGESTGDSPANHGESTRDSPANPGESTRDYFCCT